MTYKFEKFGKFLVLKMEDIEELSEEAKEALLKAGSQIEANRARKGKKPCNAYVVVNEDEPYAEAVWKLVQDEWECRHSDEIFRKKLEGMINEIKSKKDNSRGKATY